MTKQRKRKGFTLVELLVVIAILAILATVSVVGYTAFIQRAHESNAKTEAAQIKEIIVASVLAGQGYLLKDDSTDTNDIYVAPVASGKYQLAKADSTSSTGYTALSAGTNDVLKGGASGTVCDDLKDLLGEKGTITLKLSSTADLDNIYYTYVEGTTTVIVKIPFDANKEVEVVSQIPTT